MFLRTNRVIPAPAGMTWHMQQWMRGVPVQPGIVVGDLAETIGYDLFDASGDIVATVWRHIRHTVGWHMYIADLADSPDTAFLFSDQAVEEATSIVAELRNLPIA